ncbi:MAG: hypothetical protein E7609_03475 [Ruminococcaceae bacterium]|nr:hypothetical protein [Oscillospiraceae bacterium]
MARFPSNEGTPSRPIPWRLVLIVLCNTVLFFGIYAYFVMARGVNFLFWVYLGILLAAALGYVLYNRAFSDASCTYETLPYDWSHEKKTEFLLARDTRKQKSRWLLVFIFPLSLTLMFDVIFLFFGDALNALFTSIGKGLGIW